MEVEIGRVTHYYNHLNVAVLKLTDSLKLGDLIHILGHVTDLTERVASMEVYWKRAQIAVLRNEKEKIW